MPTLPKLLVRRLGPLGVAVTLYDIWRHLPEKQRQQVVGQVRKHGTRAATYAVKQGSAQIRKRRG